MADITDPKLIKFANEGVRPIAEQLRLLYLNSEWFLTRWTDEINAIVSAAAGTDVLVDGREAEGITQLTMTEIQLIRNVVNSFNAWYEGSPNGAIATIDRKLAKAQVRTLPTSVGY